VRFFAHLDADGAAEGTDFRGKGGDAVGADVRFEVEGAGLAILEWGTGVNVVVGFRIH
jgi:hypothetical protein